jgi:hypothetical protein
VCRHMILHVCCIGKKVLLSMQYCSPHHSAVCQWRDTRPAAVPLYPCDHNIVAGLFKGLVHHTCGLGVHGYVSHRPSFSIL